MKKLVKLILKAILFIPNLMADATNIVSDFVDRQNLLQKIFWGYFLSLMAGALMLYPLSGCLYLVDLVFNSNLAKSFAMFFVMKYKFIKLPLLGFAILFWVWRMDRDK